MTTKKKIFWALGIVLVLALVLLAGWMAYEWMIPASPPENVGAVVVQQVAIVQPLTGSGYPLNSVIPVRVRVVGGGLSILELWADGDLIEARDVAGQPDAPVMWHWTPAATGPHTLLVRAHRQDGSVLLSNAVQVNVSDPVGASVQISAQVGDTVASIAVAHGVSPEAVHPAGKTEHGDWSVHRPSQAPPDPETPLTPGQPVLVSIIPHYPASQARIPAASPPAVPPIGAKIEEQLPLNAADAPPMAPTLTGQVTGCKVMLIFEDAAAAEDGFYVLRQAQGETVFSRIAMLGRNDASASLSYVDHHPAEDAVYVVVAVNGAGDGPSNPWAAHLDPAACSDAAGGQAEPDGNVKIVATHLLLPHPVDRSYFYYSHDGKTWQRGPEDEHQFVVPNEQGEINYGQLVRPADGDAMTARRLTVDAWGWQDGALEHLGATMALDERTELSTCGSSSCSDALGVNLRANEGTMTSDATPWAAHFYRVVRSPEADRLVWQIATTPFPSGPVLLDNAALTEEETIDGITAGTYDITLPAFMMYGQKYYVRIIPFKDDTPVGEPSNQVILHIQPPAPIEMVNIVPPYKVTITEFRPIHWPEPDVCTGAIILDTVWQQRNDDNEILHVYHPGDHICPDTYRGEGKNAAEAFFDFVRPAVNWVSQGYQDIKQTIVDFLGDIFCNGDETCKEVLMMGLNAGLASLGLPPSMPNFDELLNIGVDYLVGELAAQITGTDFAKELIKRAEDLGLSSEEEINQWIKEQLKEGIQDTLNSLVAVRNPSCMGTEEAHRRGVEPLCLPPDVKSHLDPAGQFLPATAIIRVTRQRYESAQMTPKQLQDFVLELTVSGQKDVPSDYTVWVQHTKSWLPVASPLQGELFRSEWRHIPPLEPGESVTIPVPLMPAAYWVPGHKEAEGGWWESACGDYSCWDITSNDFWELYYHGQASVTALVGPSGVIDHYDPHSGGNDGVAAATCEAGPLPAQTDPYTVFCQQ